MSHRRNRACVVACLAAFAVAVPGCATYRPVNAELAHYDPTYGYRAERIHEQRQIGDVVLLLAFSGGGTRAAALAYAVLQELRDTEITRAGERVRLLDEIDVISSVSGGSFTAAYYGLFGDRIFADYEERFLRRNVQGRLLFEMFRPKNWIRLAGTFFDRSELAVGFYDREIFDGATFADLAVAGGPAIQINAADIAVGDPFQFTQVQFDLLCSDLSPLQVARAVAASSAVPVLMSPITLRNYAGGCEYQRPAWLDETLADRGGSRRKLEKAKAVLTYLDPGSRRFVHLVDGGIADNLGLRGPLDNVILADGLYGRLHELGVDRPSHVVVVVVNAAAQADTGFSLSAAAPSLGALIGAVTDVQLHRYNFETIELMRESMEKWGLQTSPDGEHIQTHLIEVSLDHLQDAEERHFLNNVPTSFYITDEQADRLIAAGRKLLRESGEFQALLAELN